MPGGAHLALDEAGRFEVLERKGEGAGRLGVPRGKHAHDPDGTSWMLAQTMDDKGERGAG